MFIMQIFSVLLAGKTLFIRNIRLTSLVIEVTGLVTSVPAGIY
jgi:hypothetical protein